MWKFEGYPAQSGPSETRHTGLVKPETLSQTTLRRQNARRNWLPPRIRAFFILRAFSVRNAVCRRVPARCRFDCRKPHFFSCPVFLWPTWHRLSASQTIVNSRGYSVASLACRPVATRPTDCKNVQDSCKILSYDNRISAKGIWLMDVSR